MGKEQGALLNILERMSPHDKEVILLAPIFFWAKYMRRKINTEGFQPVVLDVDFNDPVSILRAGFDLHRQANSDINGDSVNAVSNTLTNHPLRAELFPCLEDWEIRAVCYGLDKIFENQEFCAECESWSYYDSEPEEFAINVANEMLQLDGRLTWFSKIDDWEFRQLIIKAILKEKLSRRVHGLPLPGENGKV